MAKKAVKTAKVEKVGRLKIHKKGPEFSGVIWGSMRSQEQFSSAKDLAKFLDFLLEREITTLDTAATYGAPYTVEKFLGQALKLQGKRDKFEIVTKLGIRRVSDMFPQHRLRHFDSSAEHIKWSVDRSLKELGIDEIDVLIVHRADHLMDPDETGAALDAVVKKGKVRYIGVSNFAPSRFELLQSKMKNPIVTNQVQFSPIYLNPVGNGTFDLALKLGHVPMIWSPVGGGKLLTSNDEQVVNIRNLLTEIAERTGLAGPAEAAMAFVARHPARGIPIVGSGKRERVDGAIQAVNRPLDRQDWYEIVSKTTDGLELW
jgi:predicted oxidoreductase